MRYWPFILFLILVVGTVAGLGAHFAIVPAMRSACVLFRDRCRTLQVLRAGHTMLVTDQATGITYWDDGTFVHAYGAEVVGECPQSGKVVVSPRRPTPHACSTLGEQACRASERAAGAPCVWTGQACTEAPGSSGIEFDDHGAGCVSKVRIPAAACRKAYAHQDDKFCFATGWQMRADGTVVPYDGAAASRLHSWVTCDKDADCAGVNMCVHPCTDLYDNAGRTTASCKPNPMYYFHAGGRPLMDHCAGSADCSDPTCMRDYDGTCILKDLPDTVPPELVVEACDCSGMTNRGISGYSSGKTVTKDLQSRVKTTQTFVPIFAVRSDTFEPAEGGTGVICAPPLDDVIRSVFPGVKPTTVRLNVPDDTITLDARQIFHMLRSRE